MLAPCVIGAASCPTAVKQKFWLMHRGCWETEKLERAKSVEPMAQSVNTGVCAAARVAKMRVAIAAKNFIVDL